MDSKALSEIVGAELRERGYDGFRMTYLEKPANVCGVGVEIQVGEAMYRNAWKIGFLTLPPSGIARVVDRIAEWIDKVRAAPEKYRAA